jgi:toxin ParE1/3/4
MRLSVSAAAKADLAALHDYGVEHYGDRHAAAYLTDLTDTLDRIAEWPEAARIRTDVRPAVRLLARRAHNIFYDVRQDHVEIVRILHHSIDWQNEL